MLAARAAGTIVSYDLNFRPSIWQAVGGSERAIEVNRRLAGYVDVMFGNEEDFSAALGFAVEGVGDGYAELDPASYVTMLERAVREYPNLKIVATSLRAVRSASVNDWGGLVFAGGHAHEATLRRDLEILDRVGGGDSFASGLIYGVLADLPLEEALEYAVAHGALAMTTPGDTSMATLPEVRRLAAGGSARVQR